MYKPNPAGSSGSRSSVDDLNTEMKLLLEAFKAKDDKVKDGLYYKNPSFYEDAIQVDRLKMKLHFEEETQEWKLFMMMPNDFKPKNVSSTFSFPPSIVVLPASDIKELRAILQGLLMEVLTGDKSKELPRIYNHPNGKETNPRSEDFWDRDFTSSLMSGNLLLRPWRSGFAHLIKILSPRPPNEMYQWIGVQIGMTLEEGVKVCSHLQDFLKVLELKGY